MSPSLELSPLGLPSPPPELVAPIDPVESSPRFGFGEDLGLLDPEAGPGGFVVFAREPSRCELTYARNNPLRFVDPDGKDILDVAAGAANAIYNNFSLGAVPRRDSVNDDFQKGQILGDGLTVLLGMAEEQLGLRVAAGGILGFPESGGTTSVAVVGGATVAAHGKTVAAVGALQLLSAATRDSGGGRTGRKSNEKRVEAAEQRIKDLKDAKAQAKTKDEKKAIQDKIDHERLKMRTSEEHMRRNPG